MNPITPINISGQLPTLTGIETTKQPDNNEFKDILLGSIREVNSMQQEADLAIEQFATGKDVNPAEVLTAVQKADIAFRMMMQVRNKLVSAYNQIESMQV